MPNVFAPRSKPGDVGLRRFQPGWSDANNSVMIAETVDKQLGTLREGDEALAGMLTELDARLREWLSAMRAGQAVVVAGLTQADESDTGGDQAGDAASEIPSSGQNAAPSAADSETKGAPDIDTQPQAVVRPGRGKGMFQTPPPVGAPERPVVPKPDDVKAPDSSSSAEEDEALLAQLDEKTAMLIQVKRRLSNNTRGVRELIEELQAERKRGEGRTKQHSQWWRPGNEK